MPNNIVAGVEPWGGRTRAVIVDHTGPASYALGGEALNPSSTLGGSNVFGLASFYKIDGGVSNSGNYRADGIYSGNGPRPSVKLKWTYNGSGIGVDAVTQNVAGSAMTVGTTVPIVFAGGGGTGAAGTITVLTATTFSVQITSPGTGYSTAPTATVSGTGGTPPTLTTSLGFNTGGEVAATTNLTTESVRLLVLGG